MENDVRNVVAFVMLVVGTISLLVAVVTLAFVRGPAATAKAEGGGTMSQVESPHLIAAEAAGDER